MLVLIGKLYAIEQELGLSHPGVELVRLVGDVKDIGALRRAMQGVPAADSLDMLIQRLKKTKTNTEFLLSLNR